MPLEAIIRPATFDDLDGILSIYNHEILNSTGLFIYEPVSRDNRVAWLSSLQRNKYPCYVAEAHGRILGYCSLGVFRDKPAFDSTAEFSLYLDQTCRRQSLGARLFDAVMQDVRQHQPTRFRSIIGMVTTENTASLAFCRKNGFREVGIFHQVGTKFNRTLDVAALELLMR